MNKYQYAFWGVVYALLPSLAGGLLAGIVTQSIGVGLICAAVFFGFGLDVVFGKGVECRLYGKKPE